jgi:hypothetical protein
MEALIQEVMTFIQDIDEQTHHNLVQQWQTATQKQRIAIATQIADIAVNRSISIGSVCAFYETELEN